MTWCWLGIHKWGKWMKGRRKVFWSDNPKEWWYEACQGRQCELCGKTQIEEC